MMKPPPVPSASWIDPATSPAPPPPAPPGYVVPPVVPAAGTSSSKTGSAAAEVGKLLLVLFIAAVIIGGLVGWNKLSEWSDHNSAKGLKAGECLSSLPYYSDSTPSRVSCTSSAAQYRVISNDAASSYSDVDRVAAACERRGYNSLPPAKSAWDGGDHTVLCYSYA